MKLVVLSIIVAVAAAYHGPPVPVHLDVLDKDVVSCPWDPTLATYNPLATVARNTGIYIVGHGNDFIHDNFALPGGGHNTDFLWDFDNPNQGWDTDGRGTAISGAAGGLYTGVGRNITVITVRIADDPDYKNIDIMRYEQGLTAVLTDYQNRKNVNPTGHQMGVVLLSPYLEKAVNDTSALESLVLDLVNEDLVVVAPAGDSADALMKDCRNYFPGNMHGLKGLIIVGNSMNSNIRHLNSIGGDCNEIFAPGSDVYTSYYDNTDAADHDKYVQAMPGSQSAAALVAGAAAMMRSSCPDLLAAEVEQGLEDFAFNQSTYVRDPVYNSVVGYMLRYPSVGDVYPFCVLP